MTEDKQQQKQSNVPYEMYKRILDTVETLEGKIESLNEIIREKDEIIANGMKVEFNTARVLENVVNNHINANGNSQAKKELEDIHATTRYDIEPTDDVKIWKYIGQPHRRIFINVPHKEMRTKLWLSDFGREY